MDSVHEVGESSSAHVSLDIPEGSVRSRRQILHRVPPHVRENKRHVYDPVVLSLGPYHHGKSVFRQTEELKTEVLSIICGAKDKGLIFSKILDRIDEIRKFYGGVSKDEYEDKELAEMMFRDGCFVLYHMKMYTDEDFEKYDHVLRGIGMSGITFMNSDLDMLENQIPFWLIKLLISLTFDNEDEGEALVYNYLSLMNLGEQMLTRVPWEDEEPEPFHLLEANLITLLKGDKSSTAINNDPHSIFTFRMRRRNSTVIRSWHEMASSPFRSATDLRAKGIRLGPSSYCLQDIRFRSLLFYGKLQLPILFITYNTKVLFSNLIALEMSPETEPDFAVLSYVSFMRSLIDSPKDVEELREKGILFSCLENDEEVVKMFKEIDTYGSANVDIYQEVKMSIDRHCNSKAKTWMAELTHTYFRSPWTVIALCAATLFFVPHFNPNNLHSAPIKEMTA